MFHHLTKITLKFSFVFLFTWAISKLPFLPLCLYEFSSIFDIKNVLAEQNSCLVLLKEVQRFWKKMIYATICILGSKLVIFLEKKHYQQSTKLDFSILCSLKKLLRLARRSLAVELALSQRKLNHFEILTQSADIVGKSIKFHRYCAFIGTPHAKGQLFIDL